MTAGGYLKSSEFVGVMREWQKLVHASLFLDLQEPNQKINITVAESAYLLTKNKYGVITGGGPGIMEAANKGAKAGSGKSVGLNNDLPFEQMPNKYIDYDKLLNFDYFLFEKSCLLNTPKDLLFYLVVWDFRRDI